MALKIPRPDWTRAIVDAVGFATQAFSRRIEDAFNQIEQQEASQTEILNQLADQQAQLTAQLAQIQSAQAAANAAAVAANTAQSSADGGGSATARSGSATDTSVILNGTTWKLGTPVNLTTVSAGNLTITGTTVYNGVLSAGEQVNGEFRVVELAGSTTIFTGTFTVSSEGEVVSPATISNVLAFSLAESTTGSVSYRMDVRRASGDIGSIAQIDAYFFARRS